MSRVLGRHWSAILRGCAPGRLRDPHHLAAMLGEIPDALGLQRVGEPVVQVLPDGAVVGFTLLSASHASIHVPATGCDAFADLFSCAPFDAARCTAAFVAGLGAEGFDTSLSARS